MTSPDVNALSRVARPLVFGVVVLGLLALMIAIPFTVMPDATVYYLAGERLNAGHSAYFLVPGDRPIPPASAVPWADVGLLSPPPIAVLWRPLAALGEWSIEAWTVAARIALILTAAVLIWRSWPTALLVVLAIEPMIWLGSVGNVHAFVVLGSLVLWLTRDRPWPAAALAVSMAAVKLTPAILVLWLARDRRTWLPILASAIVWAAVCQLFGNGSIGDYVAVLALGASTTNWAVVGLGVVAVLVLPERFSFAAAILTSVFATSALGIHWLAALPVAAAPWVVPAVSRTAHGYVEDPPAGAQVPR